MFGFREAQPVRKMIISSKSFLNCINMKQYVGSLAVHLNELLLQLVDGQTLPLLQDGELRLLAIGGLVAAEGVLLPLRDVVGHHADAPHVGCDLPAVSWSNRRQVGLCQNGRRLRLRC